MKTVAFVHQSAELYGSDRALLTLVRGLDRRRFRPLVVLPGPGPLEDRLRRLGVEVFRLPVARLERATLRPGTLARLPLATLRSVRALDRALGRRRIDLVHSNTLATLGGAVWARLRRIPHVWHVHEIITSPRTARLGLAHTVNRLATRAVTNSRATRRWLVEACPGLEPRTTVVWNGLSRPTPPGPDSGRAFRADLSANGKLVVALVGRINRWKGQALLIDAAERVGASDILYALVGGPPPGQRGFLDALHARLRVSPLRESFVLPGFREDVWNVWDGCDLAVVPSTEPEPFGLVALEAMLASKPVVAAAHGGLTDLVRDGQTGLLVPPNDPAALAVAIARLAGDRSLRERFGSRGREVALAEFTEGSMVAGIERIYADLLEDQ